MIHNGSKHVLAELGANAGSPLMFIPGGGQHSNV